MGGFLWEEKSLKKDVFVALPGNSKRTLEDVQAYASFGDEGTTVTVNKYGNIMQISRFLNFGFPGFLCVDSRYDNPYWIQDRMNDLINSLKDRRKGLRLDLVDWSGFEDLPSLGFMYDRWPRYIFKSKVSKEQTKRSTSHSKSKTRAEKSTQTPSIIDTAAVSKESNEKIAKTAAFPLSIQYFCYQGIAIQKYLLHVGEGGINTEKVNWGSLSLAPDVCIRSLDFTKCHDFNNHWKKLKSSIVSNHHLILQHSPGDYAKESLKSVNERDFQEGAALIVSVFINDEPAQINKNHQVNLERTEGQLEISVVYKLVILQEDIIGALKPLKKDQSANGTEPTQEESDTETNGSSSGDVEDSSPEGAAAENALKRDTWALTEGRQITYAKQTMGTMFCAKNPFRKIFFAQDNRLDFAFRRNLEHIVSVCSIPIHTASLEKTSIAITCGDIAGHRVDSRASLSAIQFLCSMLKYLDPNDESSRNDRCKNKKAHVKAGGEPPTSEIPNSDAEEGEGTQKSQDLDEKYLKKLHGRVRWVLKGHLQWISAQTKPWIDGAFAPHYWPTGRRIDKIHHLSSPSLIDTPLQLLKVYHILESEPDDRDQRDRLVGELRSKVCSWIEEMHAVNERGTYTFSRKPKREYSVSDSDDYENKGPKYCFTDHVMIGMALKCVEKLGMPIKDENDVPQQQGPEQNAQPTALKRVWCYYTHDEVRRKTLKRFTVVNTASNQRMFATSRRSDDTRFLLHSKDTYLFFAANMGYFKGPKTPSSREPKDTKLPKLADAWRRADDRWTKLLDSQSKYDKFRYSEWKKPLWHAVAFVLENMGRPVTGEPPEKPAKMPNLVLLEPSWYNGLFPGRLGKESKPALHERESGRDEYWFSTFELPNILWTFGSGKDTTESGRPVEKHTIFVNLSHPKGMIEPKIVLDNWLQKPPAILDFTSEPDSVFSQAEDADAVKRVDKILDEFENEQPQSRLGIVIDVPRYSLGYEISGNQITEIASFALKTQRSAWESKKRIIWLSVRNRDVAKKVCEATRGIEKENVLAFLGRNANFDTYFHDSASAALNVWETELHLSFFRTSQSEGEALDCMEETKLAPTTMSLRFSGDFADRYWTCYLLEHGTHDREKETVGEHGKQDGNTRTLGSRLIPRMEDCIIGGDLDLELSVQDLEPVIEKLGTKIQKPEPAAQELETGDRRELRADDKRKKEHSMFLRAWQQRRVLELLIYSKMLQELHQSTNQVLQLIKRLVLQSENFGGPGSKDRLFKAAIGEARRLHEMGGVNNYDSIASQWREYAQILVVVEENLADNIDRIEQWDRREMDRQNEQPRWTDQDKRNHSATLFQLTILCKRQATKIDRLKNDVISFRESLPNRLEAVRDDISFRDSQNINLFTYVTVVFLPLGFAAGMLSMSGAPDYHLLMNFVTLSLGALGITLFTLLNAQIMKSTVSPFVHGYRALIKVLSRFMRLLWQFTRYTFFHIITKRVMKKRTSKISTQQPLNNELENPTSNPTSPEKDIDWQRRWKQKYHEIAEFSYPEARSKLEKSLDSRDTDGITTKPQESSPQRPDIQNLTPRGSWEMV